MNRLPDELSNLVSEAATSVYTKLREASREFGPASDEDHPLRLLESEAGMLELARAGAKLHYRLFRQPIESIPEGLPANWGKLAGCLRGLGRRGAPLLLQDPLVWGLPRTRCLGGSCTTGTATALPT